MTDNTKDDVTQHPYRDEVERTLRRYSGYEQGQESYGREEVLNLVQIAIAESSHLTSQPAQSDLVEAVVLRGVGKRTGDGFKDTTVKGDIVFVWNDELQPPYAPGQYPRIGCEGWSASTEQYDFAAATAEDVSAIRVLLTPTAPQHDRESVLREALNKIGSFEWDDGDEGGAALSMRLIANHALSHPTTDTQSDFCAESAKKSGSDLCAEIAQKFDTRSDAVPDDVRRLVIAARCIMDENASAESRAELDQAAEAFASRVPWKNEDEA